MLRVPVHRIPIVIMYIFVSFRSKIELGDITPHNIKQLKRLNTVVFPVSYNEKFYKDVLEAGELAKLGTDIVFFISCAYHFHRKLRKKY